MTRPLIERSAAELDGIVERNRGNRAELDLVRAELRHRTTPSARRVRDKVDSYLGLLDALDRSVPHVSDIKVEEMQETPIVQSPPPATGSIRRLFDETRKRLVETGTRNRLVHVNRANTRGNVLNIVNERSDDVHALLCAGKAMRFLGLGVDKTDADDIVLADQASDIGEDRYTDNQLETRLGPDSLQKKLLKIAREAKTAEEEQGVNVLYLALGFLTWFEDVNSDRPREAPLVLLPVELVRNARTSTYDLKLRDDDLITNLPLQRRLSEDFGLKLPDLEPDEGWRPSDYFDKIDEMITDRPRWKVDRDGMQLGFFSFSKLLMYLDLALEAWPNGTLEQHELTRGLLYEGFEPEEPLFGPGDRLDEVLPPEKLFHVVDADASQARVIEEVRSGRNLVVQGPPGTGKSQTITNIIATAAREGRTVLFVAEKMAALSVVHDRLVKHGLRDICLELHSKTANKKAVHAELARTLHAAKAIPAVPDGPVALTVARDRLNDIAAALHRPIGASGETPYSVLGRQARFIGMSAPPPLLDGDFLATMTREDETALSALLLDYGAALDAAGPADRHPFAGVGALDLQPVDLQRLKTDLAGSGRAAATLRDALDLVMTSLALTGARSLASAPALSDALDRLAGLPSGKADLARQIFPVADTARLNEALNAAGQWRERHDAAAGDFVDSAFDADSARLRAPLAAGTTSFFARWGSAYRTASRELAGLLKGPLPKAAADRLSLLDLLLEVRALRARWGDDEAFLSAALGAAWRGEGTDFVGAAAVATWCERARGASIDTAPDALIALAADPVRLGALSSDLARAEPEARRAVEAIADRLEIDRTAFGYGGDLAHTAARLDDMAASVDRYGEWVRLCRLRQRLDNAGISALAARVASGEIDASAAIIELKFARAERLWREAIAATPALAEIRSLDRHALAEEFAALERRRLTENVTTILAHHLAQLPQGAQGEMGVIRSEIGKRKRHIALRQLFLRAPNAIQRIKPVLLMSPISVAQFLTPGTINFDLLVFDEASQVRPEDALGAIARARQVVVVGDQKQLPPTSFFDRLVADGEEAEELDEEAEYLLGGAATLGELESILSLCEARGLPSRMLQWHYRSRDPSLIRVSNREFYRDELILPPSPLQEDPAYGLVFTKVDGVYDRGGKRDNRKEGEAIVARVAEHARATPDMSLGIVTFSSAQKNTITELLELARRTDMALDSFLREGQAEDVFIKNIENVQGDERDVILVSVGYGPTSPGGRLASMSFGPVNAEGGERRLNVLFTRARIRCEVFASFDPGDIDISRTAREGPRILKRYLDYAKSGTLDDTVLTGELPDTPFEEDVADVIRSFGFLADPQVGCAGFRIDIGVRHPDHPGTYLLAVECDGSTYHSALWARERDRLRQDVLEHLGWRFLRIWSTDWFYDRRAQIERLRHALVEAHDAVEAGIKIDGANHARPPVAATDEEPLPIFVIPETVNRTMPAYQRAHYPMSIGVEPHEAPMSVLAPLVYRIVAFEGPICVDEIARRVANCFGRERAGRRILAATRRALVAARRKSSDLQSDDADEFWFTDEQAANPPVRDRSDEYGATIKADALSLLEIRAALAIARQDNAGGSDEDLIRSAARLLGFQRVGAELQARLSEGL